MARGDEIPQRVRHDLNGSFNIDDRFEYDLASAVREQVIVFASKNLLSFSALPTSTVDPSGRFLRKEGVVHSLYIGAAADSPTILVVSVLRTEPPSLDRRRYRTRFFNLRENLLFDQVEIRFSHSSPIDSQAFVNSIKAIIDAGSAWVFDYTKRRIGEFQQSVTAQTYSVIGRILREKGLHHHYLSIKAYYSDGENGYYLCDPQNVDDFVHKFTAENRLSNQPASSLLIAFVTAAIPMEQSFMNLALKQEIPIIDVKISEAEYGKTKWTLLQLAEIEAFKTNNLTVHILATVGNRHLVVGYPTSIRPHVEAILSSNHTEFETILKHREISIKTLWDFSITLASTNPVRKKAAEFAADFLRRLFFPSP